VLLRGRPLVFVSSSIVGFEEPRADVRAAIQALDIAETWLFEFSATASGSTPGSQYLQAARESDVFVLIIAGTARQGTLDEYREAFQDNPRKIVPFFVGGHAGLEGLLDELRALHTIKTVDSVADLPAAVAEAVRNLVESGDIVAKALREHVESIRRSRQLAIGMPAAVDLGRRLIGDPPELQADLRTRLFTSAVDLPAPRDGRPLTRVNWLLRQLAGGPENLRVEVRYPNAKESTSATLKEARSKPERLLYPADGKREPRSFRLALTRELGGKRGLLPADCPEAATVGGNAPETTDTQRQNRRVRGTVVGATTVHEPGARVRGGDGTDLLTHTDSHEMDLTAIRSHDGSLVIAPGSHTSDRTLRWPTACSAVETIGTP